MDNSSNESGRGSSLPTTCDFTSASSRFDAFIYILISLVALFENITISVCYFRYRPLRSATNIFIISLTASDILVSVFSIPFSFGVYLCKLQPPLGTDGDYLFLVFDMLPSNLSIYSISLVAVDRVLAVVSPYFYSSHVTPRFASISVVIIWTFVTILVSLVFAIDRRRFTLFIVFMSYVFPVTIMVGSYLIIGYVATKHAKEINKWEETGQRLQKESACFSYNGDALSPVESSSVSKGSICKDMNLLTVKVDTNAELNEELIDVQPKCVRRELKSALRLLLVVGAFVIAWTPFMALNIEFYRCKVCNIDIKLVKYFKMLHYSNSAMNPLLFILLNKRWRTAFKMAISRPKLSSHASEVKINSLRDWS